MENMFEIDGCSLFLEKVLVEYENLPIFSVCHNANRRYLSLCADIDNETYIVVNSSDEIISKILHGKITMREAILLQSDFWYITVDDHTSKDIVEKRSTNDIDLSVLPVEESYFQVVTPDLEDYMREVDSRLKVNDGDVDYSSNIRISINQGYFKVIEDYYDVQKTAQLMDKLLTLTIKNLDTNFCYKINYEATEKLCISFNGKQTASSEVTLGYYKADELIA